MEVEHLSEAIPAPVSEVGSLSPTPREEPAIAIPPSSSRRQGAPAKRVKRVRRDKKKSPVNKIVEGQAESSVRPRSLPFHQSDVSSGDPFGEDEVDNVRLNDAEALRAAYMNLETEGGATGAAAFGVKRGRMPTATIAIARLYGWSSSGGFAADPGRGQQKISDDLVGGPHGGIVHFCATDARTCSAGWPGRRVYHFYVWQPVTISGVGASAQASCRNRESVPVAPPAAQADILDGHFDSPEPRPSLVHARPSELQQKLGEIKSRLDGLGTLPRVPGQRARPHANPPLPRHQSRGLSDLLPSIFSDMAKVRTMERRQRRCDRGGTVSCG